VSKSTKRLWRKNSLNGLNIVLSQSLIDLLSGIKEDNWRLVVDDYTRATSALLPVNDPGMTRVLSDQYSNPSTNSDALLQEDDRLRIFKESEEENRRTRCSCFRFAGFLGAD
jgi:hypothetical protein